MRPPGARHNDTVNLSCPNLDRSVVSRPIRFAPGRGLWRRAVDICAICEVDDGAGHDSEGFVFVESIDKDPHSREGNCDGPWDSG